MTGWSESVFRYCERGDSAWFLAEPINALSNIAFLIVALLAGIRFGQAMQAKHISNGDFSVIVSLIAATTAIGIGSFAFHVLATRRGQLADVVPIAIFMLLYLGFALRILLGLSLSASALGLAAFAAAFLALGQLPCRPIGVSMSAARLLPGWCLNGGLGYLPALAALLGVAIIQGLRRHRSAASLFAATALFAASLALRSIDLTACPLLGIGPIRVTAHALWHLANAGVLYVLLGTAISAVSARAIGR